MGLRRIFLIFLPLSALLCVVNRSQIQADLISENPVHGTIEPWSEDEDLLYTDMLSFIDNTGLWMKSVEEEIILLQAKVKDRKEALIAVNHQLQHLENAVERISSSDNTIYNRSQNIVHGRAQKINFAHNLSSDYDLLRRSEANVVTMADVNVHLIKYSGNILQILMEHKLEKNTHVNKNSCHAWSDADDGLVRSKMESLINRTHLLIMENITKTLSKELLLQSQGITTPLMNEVTSIMKRNINDTMSTRVESCVRHLKAAQLIQASLYQVKDEINKHDHLQGASVLYGSLWTSDTLKMEHDLILNYLHERDHSIRFIYSMIQSIKPLGLDTIDLSQLLKLPSKLYRKLPSIIRQSLTTLMIPYLQTIMPLPTVPSPEIITISDLSLGSCWPFEGTRGQVTFILPYPIIAEEFSIEHYPTQFDKHDHLSLDRTSAPRTIRIVGYPPSKETDLDCKEADFDTRNSVDFGTYEYAIVDGLDFDKDREQRSVSSRSFQTFQMNSKRCHLFPDDNTCNEPLINALTFFIENNWGNDKITCVYRVKLYGKIKL